VRRLIAALSDALAAAGIRVTSRFPARTAARLRAPLVAVGLKGGQGGPPGLGEYLGTAENGEELYGRRVTLEILMRIAAPDGQSAENTAEAVCDVLLRGVDGLQVERFAVGQPSFDAAADHCAMDVAATVSAYLWTQPPEEDAAVLDFKLEGETI